VTEFCPRCGTARIGAFRFCRGCRLDYDSLGPDAGVVGSSPPTAEATHAVPVGPVTPGRTGRRLTPRRLLIGGVATLFGLAAIGSFAPDDPAPGTAAVSTPAPSMGFAATPGATAEVVPGPAATFGPTNPTTEAIVIRVIDGDTIVVAFDGAEHKVRYIGMDAPETKDPNSLIEWMGPEATAANARLVEEKTVVLEKDVSEVDQFGRLLRHVWLTDGAAWTLVNLELVRQGVAIAKSYPPDVRYDGLYRAGVVDAQTSALGLFGPTPAPATPEATPKATPKPTKKPTPKPTAKPKPASRCHPSYTPCLPIVADLDCPDVRDLGKAPVRVIGPDDYRLDRDHDGLGCE
jgi:micrococcal nuclease